MVLVNQSHPFPRASGRGSVVEAPRHLSRSPLRPRGAPWSKTGGVLLPRTSYSTERGKQSRVCHGKSTSCVIQYIILSGHSRIHVRWKKYNWLRHVNSKKSTPLSSTCAMWERVSRRGIELRSAASSRSWTGRCRRRWDQDCMASRNTRTMRDRNRAASLYLLNVHSFNVAGYCSS